MESRGSSHECDEDNSMMLDATVGANVNRIPNARFEIYGIAIII